MPQLSTPSRGRQIAQCRRAILAHRRALRLAYRKRKAIARYNRSFLTKAGANPRLALLVARLTDQTSRAFTNVAHLYVKYGWTTGPFAMPVHKEKP